MDYDNVNLSVTSDKPWLVSGVRNSENQQNYFNDNIVGHYFVHGSRAGQQGTFHKEDKISLSVKFVMIYFSELVYYILHPGSRSIIYILHQIYWLIPSFILLYIPEVLVFINSKMFLSRGSFPRKDSQSRSRAA